MRNVALPASCALFLVCLACAGGQNTREVAQSPDTQSSSPPPPITSPPSGPDGSAPAPGLPGPGGTSAMSESADAAPPTKGTHTHDPGRGIDDINAIVKAHRDEARACYDRALADHQGIEGDLVIAWTIDPKGNVTKTSLDMARSTISAPAVIDCISEVIKKIQFAPSPGGFETKASYPFNFHPRHTKQAQ